MMQADDAPETSDELEVTYEFGGGWGENETTDSPVKDDA